MYAKFWKRILDFTLAFLAIIALLPLLLLMTIIGAVAMKGNPFFVQSRPGKIDKKTGEEKIFKLVKFRTMNNKKAADGKFLPDEDRLTKYGKFLRETSLDELPELINIFKGDMAIVGPRPQLIRDMIFMTGEQRKRHIVRPGLTGLAQVNGRNTITWEDKFTYDLNYIENITLCGDIRILFQTVIKVLKRSDIVREGTVSDIDYGDWLLSEGKITQEEYDNILRDLK